LCYRQNGFGLGALAAKQHSACSLSRPIDRNVYGRKPTEDRELCVSD
jgi:hypothetical protein